MSELKIRGWSTSRADGVALAGIVAGMLTTIFAGKSVGGLVLGWSGSLWLGTCAWVGTILVGVTLILSGFAWLLSAPRTYRHPEGVDAVHPEGVDASHPGHRPIERPMKVRTRR